jgi:hypothetical protein
MDAKGSDVGAVVAAAAVVVGAVAAAAVAGGDDGAYVAAGTGENAVGWCAASCLTGWESFEIGPGVGRMWPVWGPRSCGERETLRL